MHGNIDSFGPREHKGHQPDWIIEQKTYINEAMLL